jgi:serine/threonine protein kinase/tetratricopeptide (TPR) repeat protein
MIGKTISRYRIVEKLGEGGMGEVYLAIDTELERKVALKFLPRKIADDPDALERFKREARAAAALSHPNIITVYEVGRYEDQSFIAMAYVDGEPLSDELQSGITVERALQIGIQACDGLEKAHRAGIVHRDIKPDNILIDSDGRVKILDFGLATFGESDGWASNKSTAGTAHYMSPEQARREEVDARSDVFSLGAVLYEMLTGKRPFRGAHVEAVRYAVLNENPEPLSSLNQDLPPELERVVLKALSKQRDHRYNSAGELGADLEAVRSQMTASKATFSSKRLAIPGTILLLAVATFFIINPFKVRVSSEQDAVAGQNTIAIMYFENLAQQGDPQRLGEIITSLLITNFSQNRGLEVVSSQRLYDILKIKGREGAKVIDRTTATEIATTAGARWMMLGSILQVEPHLVVTSQLIDVATGNIENSQRLTGTPSETVFELVDRMTGDTRTDLALSTAKGVEQPKPLVEVSTNALDAYRYYVEGLELEFKYYSVEACESFRKAVETDPTFAMAHYHCAVNAFRAGNLRAGQAALEEAVKYAERVSAKERLYIQALDASWGNRKDEAVAMWKQIAGLYADEKEALWNLASEYNDRGDNETSLAYYQKILAIDPFHKGTYNSLAYLYDKMGDFEKSVEAINRYIELAPDEANPYDTRGDLYAFHGSVDSAIASYRKAVEIKPDYYTSVIKLGNMYLFKGQYDLADAHYQRLLNSEDPSVRSRGRRYPSIIKWYQGRLQEALEALEIAIAADKADRYHAEQHMQKFSMRSAIYTDLKQFDRALTEARIRFDILKQIFPRYSAQIDLGLASICANNGDLSQAKNLIGIYESVLDTLNHDAQSSYYRAKGKIALKNQNPESASVHWEEALNLSPHDFGTGHDLATAYLRSNRVNEAIAVLEKALARYDESRLTSPYQAARAHYTLGLAYQVAARNDEAMAQFQLFLEISGNADPELDEVLDAKKRIEELRRSS